MVEFNTVCRKQLYYGLIDWSIKHFLNISINVSFISSRDTSIFRRISFKLTVFLRALCTCGRFEVLQRRLEAGANTFDMGWDVSSFLWSSSIFIQIKNRISRGLWRLKSFNKSVLLFPFASCCCWWRKKDFWAKLSLFNPWSQGNILFVGGRGLLKYQWKTKRNCFKESDLMDKWIAFVLWVATKESLMFSTKYCDEVSKGDLASV